MARLILGLAAIFFAAGGVAHAEPISAVVGFVMANAALSATVAAVAVGAVVGLGQRMRGATPDIKRQGRTVATSGGAEPWFYPIGTTLVAGHEVRLHVPAANNDWLFVSQVISCAPIDQILDIRLENEVLSLAGYSGSDGQRVTAPARFVEEGDGVFISQRTGHVADPVDPMLQAWGGGTAQSDHRPLAVINARYHFESLGAKPKLTARVRGIRIYDPRDVGQDPADETSWQWSDNPALVAAWYVTRPWTFGHAYDQIDEALLIAAANICDELVDNGSGGTEKRYRFGGIVYSDEDPHQVLAEIVATMGGEYVEPRVAGKWLFYAGAYRAPVIDLGPDDIRRCIQYSPFGRAEDERFTRVRGQHPDAAANYQPSSYEEVRSLEALADENPGFRDWLDANPGATEAQKEAEAARWPEKIGTVDFNFVPSSAQANRLARMRLERSRRGLIWVGELMMIGVALAPGMTVRLTDPQYGLDGEVMRIVRVERGEGVASGGVFHLEQEDAGIYPAAEVTARPPVELPFVPWFRRGYGAGFAVVDGRLQLVLGDGVEIGEADQLRTRVGNGIGYSGGALIPRLGRGMAMNGTDIEPNLGDAMVFDGQAFRPSVGSGLQILSGQLRPNIGRGLTYNGSQLEPDLGDAIDFDGSDRIRPTVGDGLRILGGQLQPRLGRGLTITSGDVEPNLGDGVEFDGLTIRPRLGNGVEFSGGQVRVRQGAGMSVGSGGVGIASQGVDLPKLGNDVRSLDGSWSVGDVDATVSGINRTGAVSHTLSGTTAGRYIQVGLRIRYGDTTNLKPQMRKGGSTGPVVINQELDLGGLGSRVYSWSLLIPADAGSTTFWLNPSTDNQKWWAYELIVRELRV